MQENRCNTLNHLACELSENEPNRLSISEIDDRIQIFKEEKEKYRQQWRRERIYLIYLMILGVLLIIGSFI